MLNMNKRVFAVSGSTSMVCLSLYQDLWCLKFVSIEINLIQNVMQYTFKEAFFFVFTNKLM